MAWNVWSGVAAIFGATGVALGAFGAHALRDRLDESSMQAFEIGVRYQMIHALALLGCALLATRFDASSLKIGFWLFSIGIVLFSGSLYGLAMFGWRFLGPVTPIGGVLLIGGWISLAWVSFSR